MKTGDRVELIMDYCGFKKGSRGIITSIRAGFVNVLFDNISLFSSAHFTHADGTIALYDIRLKKICNSHPNTNVFK